MTLGSAPAPEALIGPRIAQIEIGSTFAFRPSNEVCDSNVY
jgi:hypothetical protein